MPKRTTEHRLETTSRTAFRELCDEAGWVTRDVDSEGDYGIDLEVEIFDRDETTGLTFRVQIKGTNSNPAKAISKSIRVETLDYWKSFDVPVLFVYYTAKDKRLYGKWAHAHDMGRYANVDQKTTQFVFTEDLLITDNVHDLERDVRLIRGYKDRSIDFPLMLGLPADGTFGFNSDDGHAMTHSAARLALRSLSRVTSGTVSLSPPDRVPQILVEHTLAGMRTRLMPDVSTLTLHDYQPDAATFQDDVVLSIAVLLSNVGWITEASILLCAVDPKHLSKAPEEIVITSISILLETDQHSQILDILIPITRASDAKRRNMGGIFIGHELTVFARLSQKEQNRCIKALAALGLKEGKLHNGRDSAFHYYNAGQMLRSLRRMSEAATMYDEALKADGWYENKFHFWSERGGLHWEVGNFRDSVVCYTKAVALGGETKEIEPLLLEAYLFAGDYANGLALATRLLSATGAADSLVIVSEITLRTIIEVTGLTQQDPEIYSEVKVQALSNAPDRKTLIDEMIDVNATEGFLWGKLLEVDPEAVSVDEIVTTAHLSLDVKYWVLAAAAVTECGYSNEVINAIIDMGMTCYPDLYLTAFREMSAALDDSARTVLQQHIEDWAAKTPDEFEKTSIRMHDEPARSDQ